MRNELHKRMCRKCLALWVVQRGRPGAGGFVPGWSEAELSPLVGGHTYLQRKEVCGERRCDLNTCLLVFHGVKVQGSRMNFTLGGPTLALGSEGFL